MYFVYIISQFTSVVVVIDRKKKYIALKKIGFRKIFFNFDTFLKKLEVS